MIFSKTIKFSKFTISIFSNEIVVVYIGQKKIFIKTIRMKVPELRLFQRRAPRLKKSVITRPAIPLWSHHRMSAHRKKLAAALGIALVAVIVAIFAFSLAMAPKPAEGEEAFGGSDAAVTAILEDAVASHAPPLVHGRRIKLRMAHPGGSNPPVIVVHGNQTSDVPEHYRRYLENVYRRELKLVGTPLRIEFVTGVNPYAGKRNTLTPRQEYKRKRMMQHVRKSKR